jgi:hypothetical protein
MNRSGMVVVFLGLSLAMAGVANAQPRVTVGEVSGKGATMIRGAAVRALQTEDSVTLISKDAVAGTARRLDIDMPKGRKEISAALGIGAWVEGSVERERKTLVTNLAVIDAASGKTLGVMSYDAPNIKSLVKIVRAELWTDLGELIQSAKAPGSKSQAGDEAISAADPEEEEEEEIGEEDPDDLLEEDAPVAKGKPARTDASASETADSDETDSEPASDDEDAMAQNDAAQNDDEAQDEPADQNGEPGPAPFVLGVGLAGFTRDFVYNQNLSNLPVYDLPLGPSLVVNANWYPAAHFSKGAAANIGLDVRGQLAFGLDSEVKDNTSFPTSSGGFGLGLRGRLPLGRHEMAAVVGYGQRSYSIGGVEGSGAAEQRMHPYVPSTSYSHLRAGLEARFALSEQFGLGIALAYLPTFSTGVEKWFPRATANGIEGEVKFGYAMSKSLELNAAFGLQRFALAFNPTLEDANTGKLIAGGAVDQYLSMTLGMGWRFGSAP